MKRSLQHRRNQAARPRPKALLIPALACLLFFLNGLNDALQNSAVADEVGGHMTAGYLYWTSGKYTGGIANFPLAHLLIALPVVLLGRSYELFSEQHLVLFRLPVLLMGVLLGVVLYRFTAGLFGRKAGLGALFLFCLSPNALAHASLATLDLPIAFFVFLTAYALWSYVQRPHWARMLALSLALACALATKVQAILLLPFTAVVLAICFAPRLQRRPNSAAFLWSWILLLVIPWVFINAVYLNAPPLSGHLLPTMFVDALRYKLLHAQGTVGQAQVAYLAGQYSSAGWWYYFPFAILVKTPAPTLILLGLGLLRKPARESLLFVLLPAALFLGIAMLASVNIGLRHVLVVYPFLFMLAGQGAQHLWSRSWRGAVLVILGAWYLGQAATILPHHLSYFNLPAGGARHGHRLLVDSNYDWGQNDHFLRRYVDKQGVDYQIDPGAFRPTTGRILVNVNAFYGIYSAGAADAYAWLKPFEPVNQITYTWFEYDIPEDARLNREYSARQTGPPGVKNPFLPWDESVDPTQLDAALADVQRHLHALRRQYGDIAQPDFGIAFAMALTAAASYERALEEVRQLLERDPGFEPALGLGGELMVRRKLGILRFSGDEYLTGFCVAPPSPGAVLDLARVAQSARLAEISNYVALVHFALSDILSQQGRIDEAIEQLRHYLEFAPGDANARAGLGSQLALRGQFEQGLRFMRQALEADPSKVPTVLETARLIAEQRRFGEAIRLFQALLAHAPDDVTAIVLLSKLLAICPDAELRNPPEAVRLAEHACRLTNGQDPAALDALGLAYFADGRFDEAIATARRALDLARQQGKAKLTAVLQARVARYEEARQGD